MRSPVSFSAALLPRVLDFECGDEPWEREVADWIKAPLEGNGALRAMAERDTSVWLYETDDGELIGYGSLGFTNWSFDNPDTKRRERKPVQIIPFLGVRTQFRGKPNNVPKEERYSRRIIADLMAHAEDRSQQKNSSPLLGLFVHPQNPRAIAVYEQCGFIKSGVNADGYVRMYLDIRNLRDFWESIG